MRSQQTEKNGAAAVSESITSQDFANRTLPLMLDSQGRFQPLDAMGEFDTMLANCCFAFKTGRKASPGVITDNEMRIYYLKLFTLQYVCVKRYDMVAYRKKTMIPQSEKIESSLYVCLGQIEKDLNAICEKPGAILENFPSYYGKIDELFMILLITVGSLPKESQLASQLIPRPLLCWMRSQAQDALKSIETHRKQQDAASAGSSSTAGYNHTSRIVTQGSLFSGAGAGAASSSHNTRQVRAHTDVSTDSEAKTGEPCDVDEATQSSGKSQG